MHTARKPPHSVNTMVTFAHAHKQVVLKWLILNMLDSCTLTDSNLSAVDAHGYWRWRMSLKPTDRRVLFERAEDAAIFQLAWGAGT